jgi:hypothetical protein
LNDGGVGIEPDDLEQADNAQHAEEILDAVLGHAKLVKLLGSEGRR